MRARSLRTGTRLGRARLPGRGSRALGTVEVHGGEHRGHPMPDITGINHIAFSVSDLDRSVAWYQDLLGLPELARGETDDLRYVVMASPGAGIGIGLREHKGHGDRFDPRTPGLDHLALTVRDEDELRAWEQELERRGIDFTPLFDHPIGKVVTFRDPDGIALEFWLPKL